MRFLERKAYVADKEHFCDTCCQYIMPGEMYERIVYLTEDLTKIILPDGKVRRQKRVVVFNEHCNPPCEFPEDPDDEKEYRKELEGNLEESLDVA